MPKVAYCCRWSGVYHSRRVDRRNAPFVGRHSELGDYPIFIINFLKKKELTDVFQFFACLRGWAKDQAQSVFAELFSVYSLLSFWHYRFFPRAFFRLSRDSILEQALRFFSTWDSRDYPWMIENSHRIFGRVVFESSIFGQVELQNCSGRSCLARWPFTLTPLETNCAVGHVHNVPYEFDRFQSYFSLMEVQ